MAEIDEARLGSIISQQIALAQSFDAQEREKDRSKALDYYLGNMDTYVPPEKGRSKVVSRDVADTIGWVLPGIMRVFTASDKMAMAEPVGPEDIDFARQATDGLNHVFWKQNKGYELVYGATWDSLLTGNGIVKTFWDDTPEYSTSFHSGLDEDQLAVLLDDEDVEVLAQDQREEPIPPEEQAMQAQEQGVDPQAIQSPELPQSRIIYDVKIKRLKANGKYSIEVIPPEKFLIDENATCTEDAAFTAHWEEKTRSELIAMGYERDKVFSIPEAASNQTPEEAARKPIYGDNEPDKSMELVDYFECFVRIDVDDDGEAELVRACYAGDEAGQLLHWEIWEDESPFDDIPCDPIPHRWAARSIADETMDVQDIKTVLIRQGLNNVYAHNNPQRFVTGQIENPEELQNPTFGGIVFGKPGSSITDLELPMVAQTAFEAIAYQDEVVQRRTGVGRSTMALDPETLQNQTATANQNQKDAGYSQIELLARNMAEWGWSKVFRKLLRLMIKHQDREMQLMINGKPTTIDPRHWNADMDITINVGLGTGSRDRDLMMLGQILEGQIMLADRFQASGAVEDAIDMLPKILQTMVRMAESAGIKNPEDYYPEYTEEKVAQLKQLAADQSQQPDPKVEMEQQKLQFEQQSKMADMEMDKHKAEQDIMLDRHKSEQEFALKTEQLQQELMLKREQLAAELQMKEKQIAAEMAMKREMGVYAAMSKAGGTSGVHVGGEPG